jgi:hypothetical protein
VAEGGGVARGGEKERESEAVEEKEKIWKKRFCLPNLHTDFFMLGL